MDASRPLLDNRVRSTPLPISQVIILLIVRLADPLSFTFLFPFVYFMVKDFNVALKDSEIGYHVGILASSFAVAQMVSGIPWGVLSDRVGRRPVILMGLLGTSLSLLMFGFSKSFSWAIVTRSMCGLVSGNVGVIKSAMAELTDDTNRGKFHQTLINEAKGFALLPLVGGFGAILGPMIGGFLFNPVKRYPWLFGENWLSNLLLQFPSLLPCAICSLVIGAAAAFGFFLFEEPMKLNQPNSIIAKNSLDYSPKDGEMPQRMSGIPAECSRVILCFAGQSFQKVAHNELFPIWAATSISRGGLGFDSVAIGGIMSFCGVALLIIQPLLYRRLHDRVGTLSLYRGGFLLSIPVILLFPATSLLTTQSLKPLLWPALLILAAITTAYNVFNATSINLLLAEACPNKRVLGKVNGISQTAASFARAVAPTVGGFIYSKSLTVTRPFLLGAEFAWFFLAIVASFNYYLALTLPFKPTSNKFC